MVEYQQRIGVVFAALADPTRREIVHRLARTERMRVTEIAASFPVSLAAVSKHVRVLENSGLLRRERIGREHYCSLNAAALRGPAAWMAAQRHCWEGRLDAMEAMFARRRAKARGARKRKGTT